VQIDSLKNTNHGNNFCISLWFIVSSFANNYSTLFYGENGYIFLQLLGPIYRLNHKKLSFYYEPRTPITSSTFKSKTTLVENQYYHVVIVKNNFTLSLYIIYINGILESTVQNQNAFINGGFLRIGKGRNASEAFNGVIDDVKIYDSSLTNLEILSLYNLEK
jgi:hypothetical protein